MTYSSIFNQTIDTSKYQLLPGWCGSVECQPVHQEVTGSGHMPGLQADPQWRLCGAWPVSFYISLSLPLFKGKKKSSKTVTIQPHLILLTLLYCTSVDTLKVCGIPGLSKSSGTIFPTAICSLRISLSHFGNPHNTSNISLLYILWSVTNDLWCYCNYFGVPWTMPSKMGNLINVVCLTSPWTG